MKMLLLAMLLVTSGCSATVHYRKPAIPTSPTEEPPEQRDLDGPSGLYTIQAVPARIDPRLLSLMEQVTQDVYTTDVCVGEAIGWAFVQDATARVKIDLGESRVDKELHLGALLNSNFEVTYTLYTVVSIDGGPSQSVVASGRSATLSARSTVKKAVAICVRDLHAQINNLIRLADQGTEAKSTPASAG